jgi:phosphonate transport system permease protein
VVPPLTTGRYLLYLFYRWETCVREATVLGILGIPTLGYFVIDARARQQLDTMLFFVLLASVLVVLGDLASYLARDTVRRAR